MNKHSAFFFFFFFLINLIPKVIRVCIVVLWILCFIFFKEIRNDSWPELDLFIDVYFVSSVSARLEAKLMKRSKSDLSFIVQIFNQIRRHSNNIFIALGNTM